MPLVDLKLSKAERQEAVPKPMDEGPEYPFGLRLHLDEATLDKLGLERLPASGETLLVEARAKVVAKGESEDERERRRHLELQITPLSLETGETREAARVRRFYGEKE